MSVHYEWDVETVAAVDREEYEAGDIIDHNHFDTYAEAVRYANTECEEDTRHEVVLVRDDDNGRSWAYISNGVLPSHFEDAMGRKIAKVPAKYHKEVMA